MMRLSFTDMKDRNMLLLLPKNKPIRRFAHFDGGQIESLVISSLPPRIRLFHIMNQIGTYTNDLVRTAGVEPMSTEVLREFKSTLFNHWHANGIENFDHIYMDIYPFGIQVTPYGADIRERVNVYIQTGALPSPLDQFAIHPIIDFHIGNFYISFTNQSLSTLLTVVFVVFGYFLVTKKGGGKLVPNAWQSLVEQIYDFVLNLVNEQIGGNMKQKFFPCISVTFTFSLFRNPQGMIPYSFTVTSHFLITLGLSFSIFIGITIVGFQRNGLHFLSFSLPAGVPLPLAPFLVLLELIPHCFRALSSGIRLFANMMAGHSLVKILSGFAWTMLFLNNIFYFIGDLGPLFIVLALTGLELGVAISQAHVFTILICIYLNDAINLH